MKLPSRGQKSEGCEHFIGTDQNRVSPNRAVCEECKKEGTNDWVALRMCLVCGHVGCCDSSVGVHATKRGSYFFLRTAFSSLSIAGRRWNFIFPL
jgi:hypothetical protein